MRPFSVNAYVMSTILAKQYACVLNTQCVPKGRLCIVAGDHCKGPGFESSARDLSSEVVNSLNYSATDLSDLSD